MWSALGFRESPYNTNPLRVLQDDVELLVGRDEEAIEFCTALDSASGGVLVISGPPGVGKTSFLNVQQFLLENETALFGPSVQSARQLCPVQPEDEALQLALRALDSLYRSTEAYCRASQRKIPPQTKTIGKWLNSRGGSGFNLGLTLLGFGGSFGRHVELPPVADASFESIIDVTTCISQEVVENLGFSAAVIGLDNLENLSEKQLGAIMISFRDTLFSIPNLWWILVGQAGLGSLIQALDSRVFERLTGSGLEIAPVALEELHVAIGRRVEKFHSTGDANAPLPKTVHERLFEASFGEMRFVFKYSNSICTKYVESLRAAVTKLLRKQGGGTTTRDAVSAGLDAAIGKHLVKSQIPHDTAMSILRDIVRREMDGLHLKDKEVAVLRRMGELGRARAKDFREFGIKTMQDFSSNYLTKMWHQKLLIREQEGRAVYYRLRGPSKLAHELGLF